MKKLIFLFSIVGQNIAFAVPDNLLFHCNTYSSSHYKNWCQRIVDQRRLNPTSRVLSMCKEFNSKDSQLNCFVTSVCTDQLKGDEFSRCYVSDKDYERIDCLRKKALENRELRNCLLM